MQWSSQGGQMLSKWQVEFDEALARQSAASPKPAEENPSVATEASGRAEKSADEASGQAEKTPEEVVTQARQHAEELKARLEPWAFIIPAHQSKRFEVTLDALTKGEPSS
jgi:hypothetical protein